MSRLTKIVIGVAAGLVVLAVGLFVAYKVFIESDPEPEAEIEETEVVGGGTLDGTYATFAGPAETPSFVGYRVQEVLVGGAVEQTATGRTGAVTGTFTITGNRVEEVSLTADLRTLTSDRSQRDNAIKDRGLESNMFPEATFVLAEPIDLPEQPAPGETVTVTAVGDFTLHGVTKRVEIPIEGRWDGELIQAVGTLHVVFSDYGIEAPTAAAVASIRDEGEMEFQLFFERA
ncbi:MAG TPA: YceI family protein [Acidimicrobiia bacterium]|nr:YceI family protein [Acidimicrobiia bacterium]